MGCAKPDGATNNTSGPTPRPSPSSQAQVSNTIKCSQKALEPPLVFNLTETVYNDGSVVTTCSVNLDPANPQGVDPIYVTINCDQTVPINQINYVWDGFPPGTLVFDPQGKECGGT